MRYLRVLPRKARAIASGAESAICHYDASEIRSRIVTGTSRSRPGVAQVPCYAAPLNVPD